jgi:hypothetical protein
VSSTGLKRIAFRAQFQVSAKDLERIKAIAQELPKKVRRKVVRKSLREWGESLKRSAKALLPKRHKQTRRDLAVKTKTYRRGRIWCGVGVRKDGNRVGWRSHLYDGGYRPWQKGIVKLKGGGFGPKPAPKLVRKWKGNRNARIVPFSQQRGWRDGVKGKVGARIYRILWLTRAARRWQPRVIDFVRAGVDEALRQELKGA